MAEMHEKMTKPIAYRLLSLLAVVFFTHCLLFGLLVRLLLGILIVVLLILLAVSIAGLFIARCFDCWFAHCSVFRLLVRSLLAILEIGW